MRAGTFFVRTWRLLSIAGLMFALFNSYISYPGEVAFRFDEVGLAVQYVNRETIFYGAVALFLIVYMLTNVVARLFPRIPTSVIPTLRPEWAAHRDQLNVVYVNWFYALAAAVNTVLALGLMVLSFLNRADRTYAGEQDYVWLLPLSTAILGVVILSLPVRLLLKPRPDHD